MTKVPKYVITLFWITFIAILFPYTTLIYVGTDVSPMYIFFLFFILAYYVLSKQKIYLTYNIEILYFVLYIFFAMGLISIISGVLLGKFVLLRYGSGYILFGITFFLIYNLGLIIANQNYFRFIQKMTQYLFYAIIVWFIFACIQLFFKLQGSYLGFEITNPFVTSDISHRISMNRGILSLAVEPSYLGLTASVMLSFVYFLKSFNVFQRKKYIYIVAMLLFLIIMSLSIVSFFALFAFMFAVAVSEKSIKSFLILILILLLFVVIYFVFYDALSDLRLMALGSKILENPEFLIVDLSSASRAAAIIAPQMSLGYDNIWTGFLFSEQNEILKQSVSSLGGNAAYYLTLGVENSAKIKSTYGVFVFQYGIIGAIALFLYCIAIYINFRGYFLKALPFMTIMHLAYIIQVPLTYPLIPGLMAIMLILVNVNKRNACMVKL